MQNIRAIKYRVWDTKQKKFLEFVPPREYMLDHDEWSHHDCGDEASLLYPGNFAETFNGRLIWQQFTGLVDKNGVEIYEGDICWCCFPKYGEIECEVVFLAPRLEFVTIPDANCYGQPEVVNVSTFSYPIEVTSNIFSE